MGFYVVGSFAKDQVPLRVRARSSSFCNLSVTNEICRGCLIADVPAIVGSIDIVMGEIDQVSRIATISLKINDLWRFRKMRNTQNKVHFRRIRCI